MTYEQNKLFETEYVPASESVERAIESPLYEPYQVTQEDRDLVMSAANQIVTRCEALFDAIDAEGIKGRINRSIFAQKFYEANYPEIDQDADRIFMNTCLETDENDARTVLLNPYALTLYGSEAARQDILLNMSHGLSSWAAVEAKDFCEEYLGNETASDYLHAAKEFCDQMEEARFMHTDEVLRGPLSTLGVSIVAAYFPGNETVIQDWFAFIETADLTNAIIGENGDVMEDTLMISVKFVNRLVLAYEATGVFYDAYAMGDKHFDSEYEDGSDHDDPDALYFEAVREQRMRAAEAIK